MLIILAIILGYGQLLRFDLFSQPVYLHDIVVVIYVTTHLKLVHKNIINLRQNKILLLIFSSIIVSSITAIAKYPLTSLFPPALYLLRLICYILFAISLHNNSSFQIKYLHLSGLIVLAIGLFQFIFMRDMRYLVSLGWDDHLNRLIMPFYDPTFTGAFLGITSIFAFESKKTILSFLYLPGIALTYARSIWISFLSSFFLAQKSKILILTICILGILFVGLAPKTFGEGTNILRTYSVNSRISNDLNLLATHKWDLFFGIGYNSFAIDNASHSKGANNSYLQILLTTGVLGLLATLLLIKKVYEQTPYRQTLMFVIIASLFNNVLLYPPITLYLILLFTAPSEA